MRRPPPGAVAEIAPPEFLRRRQRDRLPPYLTDLLPNAARIAAVCAFVKRGVPAAVSSFKFSGARLCANHQSQRCGWSATQPRSKQIWTLPSRPQSRDVLQGGATGSKSARSADATTGKDGPCCPGAWQNLCFI